MLTLVPGAGQTAWLSFSSTRWPNEVSLVAAVTQLATTHGVINGQPLTECGFGMTTIDIPLTFTRGIETICRTVPPCMQKMTAFS
jgi:hypothetical protein